MTTTFDPKGELFINGAWTDISSDILFSNGMAITRGTQSVNAQPDPSTCTFTLNNASGKYSPDNPTGPYYGYIGRNTPFRASVQGTSTFLDVDGSTGGYASTPHVSALNITGDIDVRIELDASVTSVSPAAGSVILAQKFSNTSAQQAWRIRLDYRAIYFFEWWDSSGTPVFVYTYADILPGRALRWTLDVDNGLGGYTLTAWYSDSITGTWNIGYQYVGTTGGATSIQSTSTSPLTVGGDEASDITAGSMPGHYRKFELRSGIDGTVVADPDFTAQTGGATSFTDAATRVWTINGTANLSDRDIRMIGEVSEWPATWVADYIEVSITASGLLRRLNQGQRPEQSPLTARTPIFNPLAYWPMEDGTNATNPQSGVSGGQAMVSQNLTFAGRTDNPATLQTVVMDTNGGTQSVMLRGYVTPYTSTNEWSVYFLAYIPNTPTANRSYMDVTTTGTVARWSVEIGSGGVSTLVGFDEDGNTLVTFPVGTSSSYMFNTWLLVRLYAYQNGSAVGYNVTWALQNDEEVSVADGSLSSASVGTVTTVGSPVAGYSSELDGLSIGQIAVYNTRRSSVYDRSGPGLELQDPINGYFGERSTQRVTRVAWESNTPARALGVLDTQQRMGYQTISTSLAQMQLTAASDDGLLIDDRTISAMTFKDKSYQYNETPVVLSYSNLQLGLTPTKDDVYTVNSFTATREGAGSATYEKTTGALNSGEPGSSTGAVGYYASSATYSLYADDQIAQRASWEVAKGTVDAPRFTNVTVELGKDSNASIKSALVALDVGGRLQVTSCPSDRMPPGTQDLLVRGYTETITSVTRTLTYNCIQFTPWNVAVAGDTTSVVSAKADTSGSTLSASATSSATVLHVATTSGATWTTDQTQYPLKLWVAGEVVSAQTAGFIENSNPTFESGTSDWTATSATIARSSTYAKYGTYSGLLTSTSGSNPRAEAGKQVATAGNTYWAVGWLYAPVSIPMMVGVNINWYTSGSVYISTSSNTVTITPGEWTLLSTSFVAPATTAFGGVVFTIAGTPGAGYQLYGDQIMMIDPSTAVTTSPQTLQVVRSINGVVKNQSSGATVRLNTPAIVAL